MARWSGSLVLAACLTQLACGADDGEAGPPAETTSETSEGSEGATGDGDGDGDGDGAGTDQPLVLAVIGDYGDDGPAEAAVAELVHSWAPDHVLTVGDNNYPDGEASTIDANVGQYYSEFIGDYVGEYGPGAAENRFWPVPGNHDWYAPGLQPYLDYFTLPGTERYYALALTEQVAVFAIDSDSDEPHGYKDTSPQAQMFFKPAFEASPACWNIVLMHHAPYSSGYHGSDEDMRWPFAEWGADIVFAGHDHHYERLDVDGMPYFVNGLGGRGIYELENPELPETVLRYDAEHGAQLMIIDGPVLTVSFFDIDGVEIDSLTIEKDSCE